MSFILEALKKSDRERHHQKTTQKDVRQRTLAVAGKRSSRRWFPWLLLIVILILGLGGWIFSMTDSSHTVAVESPDRKQPAVIEKLQRVQPAEVTDPVAPAATESPVNVVEPAPLPRQLVESTTSNQPGVQKSRSVKGGMKQQNPVSAVQNPKKTPVETTTFTAVEPQAIGDAPLKTATPEYLLYEDLPRNLRSQMPNINMSMHFFTDAPERRLVRINNRLMHEGDWLTRDLQVVEIISTGVLLDYLGKTFELSNLHK